MDTAIQQKKKTQRKKTMFIVLMLAIPVLHFLVFWVYVNFKAFTMTLYRFNVYTGQYEWFGLEKYIFLFEDIFLGKNRITQKSFLNSLSVFPIQNFIILPLSFVCAFFLFKKVHLSNLFRVIFFLPSILSIVVLTMSFKYMFNADFGPIELFLNKAFGSTPDWFAGDSPTAFPMVYIFCVWAGLGYNIVLLNGAIARIPTEILESARLDGVNLRKEMIQIVLPLIWPTLSTLFILGSLSVFSFFLQPMLLVGKSGGVDGNVSTIALQIFYLVNNGYSDGAAVLGVFFSLIGLPFVVFIKWLMEKITPTIEF